MKKRISAIIALVLVFCMCFSVISFAGNDIYIDLGDLFLPDEDGGNTGDDLGNDDNNNNDNNNNNNNNGPSGKDEDFVYPDDNKDNKEEDKQEEKPTYNTSFPDVKETDWFYTYVTSLASKGIIQGRDTGAFDPQAGVTRAEFLKMLVLSMDYDLSSDIVFDDVRTHWSFQYVSAAVKNGIISYDEYNGKLNPDEKIWREEAAKLIVRAAQIETGLYKSPYSDTEDENIVALYAACLMQGDVDKNLGIRFFNPKSSITRAEVSTVFTRLIEYNEDKDAYVEKKMVEYGLEPLELIEK